MLDLGLPAETTNTAYRVLARKYRPQHFDTLIGQEILTQTLTNAFQHNRIHHAYLLTGVRGVGKTTTARIIARAMNCLGKDGKGGPTITPCDECPSCLALLNDRHQDVFEMDAASKTGIDDIREIIESLPYKPVLSRYKVYIIDEVHMLSKQAFNALLKTLEEPPQHVKFIFATTEVKKVPITILSRCQRFDLRRVQADALKTHLQRIADLEQVKIEAEALLLIARAADGSVRDGLSILDQALSLNQQTQGEISLNQVSEMIGGSDIEAIHELLDCLLQGHIAQALEKLSTLHQKGVEATQIIQDLKSWVHALTCIKIAPHNKIIANYTPDMIGRAKTWLETVTIDVLNRVWQMLLKAEQELGFSAQPEIVLEMCFIRMTHLAQFPAISELINDTKAEIIPLKTTEAEVAKKKVSDIASPITSPSTAPVIKTFDDILKLCDHAREMILKNTLQKDVYVVELKENTLSLRLGAKIPKTFAKQLADFLQQYTKLAWHVNIVDTGGVSWQEKTKQDWETLKQVLSTDPQLTPVFEVFPDLIIKTMHDCFDNNKHARA